MTVTYNFSICSILRRRTATDGTVHCRTWPYGDVRACRMRRRTQHERALRHCTSPYIDVRGLTATQVAVLYIHVRTVSTYGAVRKADASNARSKTPHIWRMSYHTTNSIHVIDHFSRTLRSLRYMRCVTCCWKSRLTPAVHVLEGAGPLQHTHYRRARDGVLSPTGDWPIYMVRLYITLGCNWRHTVLTYGEALADRIVSYRDILCDIVSYLSFSLMAV